jgi:manganese transport protein
MVAYVIGTGSVTTMASAGASHGMTLVWTLVLASLFTHVMFSAISKVTVVSGRGILSNFRDGFGAPVTACIILAMVITQVASLIGVMGIMTDVLQEWSRPFTTSGEGIGRLPSAVALVLLVLWLFWNGRHELFLRAAAVLVAMMGLSFFLTASAVPPSPGDVLQGLVPRLPTTGSPHLLVAGMAGTTLASVCLFSRSIVVLEKGWRPAELPIVYRDSLVAAILLLVMNAAIMACAAGTLHDEGLPVERAIDMVRTLQPLAGPFAATAFVVGILAAGLSSMFANVILGPWMIADFFGRHRDLTAPGYRLLVLVTASVSLVIPVFGGSPVQIMIASQAVSPLIMPLIALFTWLLLLKKGFSAESPNSRWMNLGLAVTVLYTLYMLVIAARGFLGALR